MRIKHALWALGIVTPSALTAACGDDETTGTGGDGQGGSTSSTTSGMTTSSSVSTATTATAGSTAAGQSFGTTSSATGAGGATGATSGAGGGAQAGQDTCPGTPITLSPGDETILTGSTAGLASDTDVFCAPESASPDAFYQLDITAACSLSIGVSGANGFTPAVSLRYQQCASELAGDQCEPDSTPIVLHQEASTMWVIVEGLGGASGEYALNVSCSAPVCGDAVLNPGEACDFGPDIPGDTCNAACQVEDTDAADTCSDVTDTFAVPPGESSLPLTDLWFHNADSSDDYKGTCIFAGETGGKDEVFRFTPEVSGELTIATAVDLENAPVCITFLEPECWYSFLYVRGADCEAGAELACNGIDVFTGVNQLTVPVTAGEVYHLFVDGLNDTFLGEGPYTVHFSLAQ